MNMNPEQLQRIIEAALMVAGRPMTVANLQKLFDEPEQPTTADIREAIKAIREHYATASGIELHEVASGFQFQAKTELRDWLCRLWEERPAKYSRALLETLALVAYRQPVTRAEVEEVRGVTVSTHITKTLLEREWIRVVGYKDVPGKPALYGTTQAFLDHFNLKNLSELPTLAELRDLDSQEAKLQVQLELANSDEEQVDQEIIETQEQNSISETEESEENIAVADMSNTVEDDQDTTETEEDMEEMLVVESQENEDEITIADMSEAEDDTDMDNISHQEDPASEEVNTINE